jgi:hypothetical protein
MAATGFGCEFGDCPLAPVHLITNITNGATVSLCDDHYAPGLIPLLAAALGVDPGDFYATVERYLKRQAVKADKDLADAQAAKPVKGSKAPAASPDDDQACGYCGNPLDDGESHLHAGQLEQAP